MIPPDVRLDQVAPGVLRPVGAVAEVLGVVLVGDVADNDALLPDLAAGAEGRIVVEAELGDLTAQEGGQAGQESRQEAPVRGGLLQEQVRPHLAQLPQGDPAADLERDMAAREASHQNSSSWPTGAVIGGGVTFCPAI